jgi:hypothetical protein
MNCLFFEMDRVEAVVDYDADYDYEEEEDQFEEIEEWRRIGGFDNYSVSNLGNVRNDRTGRILRAGLSSTGYLIVILYQDGTKSTKYVHHLVATTFLGDSEGRDIDHQDRIRTNNHVSNVRYVSRADNCRNKTSHRGTIYQFVETLPDNAIELTEYGTHHFDNLYYYDGVFYVFTGLEYRILPHLTNQRTHSIYVQTYNTEHQRATINVAKYRRSIDDLP